MAMLDSLFSKGFKASKCKTMLKLTIPRIKLLRNRREIQIKQMRRDIAKLLETGQEATARIRVEHIIREENMMAAQEILELFCELIAVRLPIIEIQRECPLDLKEAISSVCFAAPRCSDLPELLQVQLLFTSKYGKEFAAAATELMPDCGVNRQLIELLSIRAPTPEKKLTLLKEIAEEHKVDWDPAASETELFKSHEDLLFVSGSKLPLPKEKHEETLDTSPHEALQENSEFDSDMDILDLPSVPMESVFGARAPDVATAPIVPPLSATTELEKKVDTLENVPQESNFKVEETNLERFDSRYEELKNISAGTVEDKQFLPFIAPPSPILPSSLYSKPIEPPSEPQRSILRTTSEVNVDLQDVLAAAQNAAESAERAAAAARAAASLAQIRISEITKKKNEPVLVGGSENPFHKDMPNQVDFKSFSDIGGHSSHGNVAVESPPDENITVESEGLNVSSSESSLAQIRISEITEKKNEPVLVGGPENPFHKDMPNQVDSKSFSDIGGHSSPGNVAVESPPDEKITVESEGLNVGSSESSEVSISHDSVHHTPQRLPSMEDDTYFSYPNLFTLQNSNEEFNSHTPAGNSS